MQYDYVIKITHIQHILSKFLALSLSNFRAGQLLTANIRNIDHNLCEHQQADASSIPPPEQCRQCSAPHFSRFMNIPTQFLITHCCTTPQTLLYCTPKQAFYVDKPQYNSSTIVHEMAH